ncbi:hypothetical protein CONLIGDRAFT_675485 [Coniochaeta ligniaria NRRL 30616]|uniref:ADP-ribosylation factor n=1 Tax=Coniochaeta ligniaria NRRL 30616 TaxID=1408157 RepID=A0A1J7JM82_9PEZI|nr:hypothetical protein CONLIGDRAFT_675485 [Coniochaeta ligniaria NRRL 30616]
MKEPRTRDLEGLRKKFENFDEPEVYEKVRKASREPDAQNFVVLFGPHHAKIAVDLGPDDFEDLFALKEPDYPVRWINFWNTTQQGLVINNIGDKYGFTRRLRASIVDWDKFRHKNKEADAKKRKLKELLRLEKEQGTTQATKTDLETGLNGEPAKVADLESEDNALAAALASQNFRVLQSSLNYTTTDYGTDFFCFGANWLHVRPTVGDKPDQSLIPPRHWSWLALCADDHKITDTVISIHEAPNYESDDATWQAKELLNMRRNTIAVLEQLSDIGIKKYNGDIFLLKAIREAEKQDSSKRSITMVPPDKVIETAASNLFYYLFEDYQAVMPVLKNSGDMIKDLTRRVLGSARKGDNWDTADVIPALHKLGRDLRQLQHLFESYKNLFESILKPPDLEDARIVKLEGQARDRFKRLKDRLQLLMLNTIREYIDEKNELSSTYFNLTAQKDSQATARLTRSATLLAKLSVFFLPISFITSYFSVQITELNNAYTAKTYWYTFAVTATVSFMSLFFFSKLLMFVIDMLDGAADFISRKVGKVWRNRKHEKKE